MMLKENKLKIYLKNIFPYVVLFCVSFLLLLPMSIGAVLHGHDISYHLQAMKSLDVAYKNKCFFSRIYELTCQDYGYGTGLFYSMIPSMIIVLIKNWFNFSMSFSIGLELTLILFLASIIVFKLVSQFSSKKIALLVSVLYILFPYFISNIYIRFSLTENWFILLVPIIATSLYELIEKKDYFKFFVLFVIGYSLAIMIHFAITIYITFFAFIYLAINYKEILSKKSLIMFFIACGFVLLISSAYYVPMLVAKKDINLSNLNKMVSEGLWITTLSPYYDLTLDGYILNLFLTFPMAIMLIVYAFYLVYFIKNWKTNTKLQKNVFIVSSSLLFAISPLNILWFIIDKTILVLLQFTWRLYIVYSIFVVYQIVYLSKKIRFKILNFAFIGLYITISLVSYMIYTLAFINNVSSDYDKNINMLSTNSGCGSSKVGDYFPNGADNEYIFHRANEMFLETNSNLTEFANYQSINQVNFNIDKPTNGYAVINIPYDICDGIKIYQYDAQYPFNEYELSAENKEIDGTKYLMISFKDFEYDSKIIIDYENCQTLNSYLKENPFEFIVKNDVSANFTNFIKTNAHNYKVDVSVTEKTVIELPTLYYKGYKIELSTQNGIVKIKGNINEHGFLQIEVPESGTLHVKYSAGFVNISNVVSIVSILGFIVFAILLYNYEKKQVKNSSENLSDNQVSLKVETNSESINLIEQNAQDNNTPIGDLETTVDIETNEIKTENGN